MVVGAILCGGYSKRLLPLTRDIPKVLLPLKNDYTILDKQIRDFKISGIDNIYLLVGYKKDKIIKKIKKDYNNSEIKFSIEPRPMGTLFAVKNFWKDVEDDIIVKNGDTITYYNIKDFYEYSKSNNYKSTITVGYMKSASGVLELENNRIINFIEKPELNIFVNTGMYYFSNSIKDLFFENYDKKNLEETVFLKLIKENLMFAYSEYSEWYPVDNHKDYEEVRKIYKVRKDRDYGYIEGKKSYGKIFIMKNKNFRTNKNYIYEIKKGMLRNGKEYKENDKIVGKELNLLALKNTILEYYML
ncbi:MAG: nucleotidyltransferase family protein [Thermoplasmata archaeon]|jgi:NDP-sugar pyrophosphorylase family protein